MYLSFYQLKEKPFEISTDPKFLWLGERHEEALATLRYGVQYNKGFLLLTGDIGTGKTTLINALLKTLGKDTIVASIRDPALDPMDFFNYTAHVFGMEGNFTSKVSFLIQFERFLYEANSKNKKVLLIIDEAQRISQSLLEEVRLISNIEKEDSKLLNIFFIGQLEFNDILLRPQNRAIRQRITINYNITPLSEQETGRYIKHRLEVAGAEEEILSFETLGEDEKGVYVKDGLKPPQNLKEIFTHDAAKEIYSFSKGYPRLINIICDRCLLTGFVEGSPTITPQHVKECAKELTIPRSIHNKITDQQVAGKVPIQVPGEVKSQVADQIPIQNEGEEVAEKQEKDIAVPPQKSVSASEISDDKIDGDINNNVRKFMFGCGALLLLILCYLGLFRNGTTFLQGQAFVESVQSFLRQTDKTVAVKEPGTEHIIVSSQHKPVIESNETKTNQENNGLNSTVRRDVASEPENDTQEKYRPAVLNSGSQKNVKGAEPLKEKTKFNAKMAVVAGNNDSGSPESSNPSPRINNPLPAKNVTGEKEQVAVQEIQVNPLLTFEKLVIPVPKNSNLLPTNSLDKLNELAESLLRRPSYKIMITGFTDSTGDEAFNEKLSEFRANNVKSYLVGRGLKESRITTQGLGSKHPIASNDTFSGRIANRRVEIEIVQ